MLSIPQRDIRAFQRKIFTWYAKNKRDLPWRRTRDPYKILVSEVMLQQTQVSRVISKYEAWLQKFPRIEVLAEASTRNVLAFWSGLGYNRRALNLQKAARMVNDLRIKNKDERRKKNDPNWYWPKTVERLKLLPGIGEYTARAVTCFAFNEQVAVVDTNVRKVILTQFFKQPFDESRGKAVNSTQQSEKELQNIADQLLPEGRARDWNYALMDFASSELKSEKIPIPKQSRFKDSNRYYRGKLLRLLLSEQSIFLKSLGKKLKDDFTKETDEEWLSDIIAQMEREGFIRNDGKIVSLLSET